MLNFRSQPKLVQQLSQVLSLDIAPLDRLFDTFPTAEDVLHAKPSILATASGLTLAQVKSLRSAVSLTCLSPATHSLVQSPQHVFDILRSKLALSNNEQFYCLYLNSASRLILCERVALGSLNSISLQPRDILRPAILHSAASIICAHNHPSGSLQPSQADILFTHRLDQAADIVGVELLDHVILTHSKYLSLKQSGHWPKT
ncbi:JAB domain-containing protein [Saccharibacillus qingshengii]|uniref:JAB domain-containing protein n=1 Tax=Saccharibacillus qingshengii TaxID=1763540 RepID=UPI0015582109|nr:JAB domain-containing protein [Saccharibacillus qingshengii]